MGLGIIGVPTNSAGRHDGVAKAPCALRQMRIVERLGGPPDIRDEGDVKFLLPSTTSRDSGSGIIAPDSLVSMVDSVRAKVQGVFQRGRFPLVIGGDCPVLLGCLAACKGMGAGLIFVDGHEDAYPAHQSPTGEAADMELGFALGLESPVPVQQVIGSRYLVDPSAVCIFGARDRTVLQENNVRSLAGTVKILDDTELSKGSIASRTKQSIENLTSEAKRFWLHVDLDVLSTESMPAVDYPQPGGLSWSQLEELTNTVLSSAHVIGCDVTIYNPDLDPDNRHAKRIVSFLADTFASI